MNAAFITGLLAVLLAYLYDKKRINWGLVGAMAILTIFTAIRWEWGNDMPNYEREFMAFGQENIHFWEIGKYNQIGVRLDRSSEILWIMVNLLCQPIGFFGMTILLSVIQGVVVFLFIREFVPRGNTFFAIFIYCFNPSILVLGCSMMRQWTAMCAILLSMKYLCDKKFIPFAICVIVASLFHTSALFLLLLAAFVYIAKMKADMGQITAIAIFSLLWVFVIGRIANGWVSSIFVVDVFEDYASTLEHNEETASIGIATILNIIVALIAFVISKHSNNEKIHILSTAYLGFIIFLPFATTISMAGRMLYYFDAMSIAVIPNILRYSKQPLIKNGVLLWVIVINLFKYIQFFHSATWSYRFMNYHTIFEAPTWM